jgi:hypothetical protein
MCNLRCNNKIADLFLTRVMCDVLKSGLLFWLYIIYESDLQLHRHGGLYCYILVRCFHTHCLNISVSMWPGLQGETNTISFSINLIAKHDDSTTFLKYYEINNNIIFQFYIVIYFIIFILSVSHLSRKIK